VRYIPAAATESWLEQQSMGWLGINRNDYTVFLINWYGRPDFQFHTYTNIGPPTPTPALSSARSATRRTSVPGAGNPGQPGSTTFRRGRSGQSTRSSI
jgi:hypothetical protein